MSKLTIILMTVVGALVVLFAMAVVIAFVRTRRLAKLPPPPPCKCPACSSEQIEIFLSGLWDGEDLQGRSTGGACQIGTCKSCGVHCEHISIWDVDTKQSRYESRILTDEQWERETAATKKRHREMSDWPFITGDQSHVA